MVLRPLQVQEMVYSLTQGRLGQVLRYAFLVLLALGLLLAYQRIYFKGLNSSEAMDLAHIGRQLADGKGFSTLHIRPVTFSILGEKKELMLRQPDIVHAPIYPSILSKLFQSSKIEYEMKEKQTVFSPEWRICVLSEIWLILAIIVFYITARRIADFRTSLVALLLLLFCHQLWMYAISCTAFTFLLFLFSLLCYSFARFCEAEDEATSFIWSTLISILIGIGFLTKYRFGLLLLPWVTYLMIFGGKYRWLHTISTILLTVLIATPWLVRNHKISNLPLGLSTYTYLQNTDLYPGSTFEQQLKPNPDALSVKNLRRKWMSNTRTFFEKHFQSLGGNFLVFFFTAGLLFDFKSPQLRRLRYFTLLILGWFMLLLPFIWNDDGSTASGNLYVLLVPLIFLFGSIFFFVLLDRLTIHSQLILTSITAVFVAINSVILVFALLPPRPPEYQFPPYYPPMIFSISKWMEPEEVMMSDMPWAVAWYGNTPCMTLTKDVNDFLEINDYRTKISAIYVTPITLYGGFANDILVNKQSWVPILLRQVPENFPLRVLIPSHRDFIFLTDRVRGQSQLGG
jgi:hypothetical protein